VGGAVLTGLALAPPRAARRSALDALITLLAPLGLICACISAVISVETAIVVVNADGRRSLMEAKPALYYAAHAAEIAAMMGAGILAVICGRSRTLGIGARIGLYVICTVSIVWALVAYRPEEILSTDIFGGTGPFVWLSLLVVAAGADRRIWLYVDRTILGLAYGATALSVRALLQPGYSYYLGYSKFIMCATLLTWLGGWALLTATRLSGWRLLLRCIPAAALLPVAVAAQARSWSVIAVLLFAVFVVLRARERGDLLSGLRSLAVGLVIFAVLGALFYAAAPRTLGDAAAGLAARATDDTRSQQYVAFFNDVPVTALILGRGPKGVWRWPGFGEYQYFDNGFLWTLFQGGVPMLSCYFAIILWPAVRTAFGKPAGDSAAAACMVLLWGLCMTGISTFILPSVGLSSYLVSLFAGRCWLFLAESRARQRLAQAGAAGFAGGGFEFGMDMGSPPARPAALVS
jgi:hypothetical protein